MSTANPFKKLKLADMDASSQLSLDEKSLNLFSRQNAALGMSDCNFMCSVFIVMQVLRPLLSLSKCELLSTVCVVLELKLPRIWLFRAQEQSRYACDFAPYFAELNVLCSWLTPLPLKLRILE